VRSRY